MLHHEVTRLSETVTNCSGIAARYDRCLELFLDPSSPEDLISPNGTNREPTKRELSL